MIINFSNIGSGTGGGGGTPSPSPSNYRIVDALSAITNPTEGLMAFVKAKTKTTNGVRVEISDWNAFPKEADGRANGYLAIIQDENWDESTQAPNSNSILPVILIGNQFNGFENDGDFHSTSASHNGDNYTFVYKTHNGEESGYGSYIDLYMIDKPCKLWLNNGCSTAATTPYEEITQGQTYLYSAGQWVEIVSTTIRMEDIPLSTSADTAEFVAKVRASVARGIYPSILLGGDICTYNGDSGDFVKFAGDAGNEQIILYFSDEIYNSDGFDDRGFKLDAVKRYTLPVASANELGGVKIGSGINIDQNGVISAQGGGAEVVLLNKLTEQERLDLYSAITACYDYSTESFTSAWTEDKYAFFIDLRDHADQQEYDLNDTFEGFFPMRVARCHPTDYGGAVFFTGVEGSRYGEGEIINIKFVIVHDGSIDKGKWINKPSEAPTDLGIKINSGGTIDAYSSPGLDALSSLNSFGRIRFVYYGDGPIVGDGALLSFHRKNEQIDGQDKLVEYISGLCNVEGVVYKGTWHFIEYEWGEFIAPDTWTAFS